MILNPKFLFTAIALATGLTSAAAGKCTSSWKALGLSATNTPKGHSLAIRDLAGIIQTIDWDSSLQKWSEWKIPEGQHRTNSDPWLQAPVGNVNNLMVLSRQDSTQRTNQWILTPTGFVNTIGIGESDSILFRPASGRMGPDGQQALVAVFQDSSVKLRVWDSLDRSWGDWQDLGAKTAFPPSIVQVTPNDLNLYITLSSGEILQNWWHVSSWSGWVVPAYGGSASEPSSVNLNWADHLLFSLSDNGTPQVRYWNGSSWTGWNTLAFPAVKSLSPVVVGVDSVLLYGLDVANQIVRMGGKFGGFWSKPETLGNCPKTVRPRDTRILSAAQTPDGTLLAIRGWNDSLYTLVLGGQDSSCRGWNPLVGQPKILSNPSLQATVGEYNNLMVLGESNGSPRTFQWLYHEGQFLPSIGIGESDSVVSLASGRLTSTGNQALFAVFKDSSVHLRIWDSVARHWGDWSELEQKSTKSLGVNQVTATDLNLFAIGENGDVNQRWWKGTTWSPWVVPSYDSIISGASSANFDWSNHVLFGIGPDGFLVERTWDGSSWTSWHSLAYKPLGEAAPVIVHDVLHLFFVDADSSIRQISRTLDGSWSNARSLGKVPPTTSCFLDSSAMVAGIPTLGVHAGVIRLTGDLAKFEGIIQLVLPNGKTKSIRKTAGSNELRVRLQGIGFLRFQEKTVRVIGVE